jgi:ADP-ribosylglycohydrolase
MNDRLAGILLGTAVGDALGLPAEGLSPPGTAVLRRGPVGAPHHPPSAGINPAARYAPGGSLSLVTTST